MSSTTEKSVKAVSTVANREAVKGAGNEFTTQSGIRVRIRPVAAFLIAEVQQQIEDPEMRTFKHPETGQMLENPDHPEYQTEMREVQQARLDAATDALLMFGVQLLDGLPDDDEWLEEVHYILSRSGTEINLDTDNKKEKELLYKKYVVADASLITRVSQISGVTQESVDTAKDTFPSN